MEKQLQRAVYLTIHGHFYQPPRENPWLEYIEEQDSAAPFHNWNERINYECYTPNSVARITDQSHKILDIVNNYSLINYNYGPTLLKWVEENSPETYFRILEADKISQEKYSGQGSAIAQVYNHIIMPLANLRDKITQVYWGIRDFENRFGRKPRGIWLSETAVCEETLNVLIDYGIEFTILSPFQADKVQYAETLPWEDVSRGNIDPAKPYRCTLTKYEGKEITLFFYDGSISKSVAFEGVLYNGDKLVDRIKEGVVASRDYDQLVHLATDGESYGHHTPFGDMALAYALKARLEKEGFILTNYGEYLEKHPPGAKVIIKENTSWSCSHGVGRWKEDCGCSTGGQSGWNQKWRKPLRQALDWLNDELAELFEKEGKRYFKDVWLARNNYIEVLLDRSEKTIHKFIQDNCSRELSNSEIADVLKLLEMQKNAMFMFTSCGWFFSDVSGLETTQILKYAARATQLACEFGKMDLENDFLIKLSEAQSNIKEYGNGKDIYLKFVRPSIVTPKQVVSHWAISSLFENYNEITNIHGYKIKKYDYARTKKGSAALVVGRIELYSEITSEINDMIFGLLHFGEGDFHCVIKGFSGNVEYLRIKEDMFNKFNNAPLTEVLRGLDEHFGREYWTLKELFIDKKRNIIKELIQEQLEEFSTLYYKIYYDSQNSIMQLLELGLSVPPEFKIAAEYTLSRNFNKTIEKITDISDIDNFNEAEEINDEAKRLGIKINKQPSEERFTRELTQSMNEFADSMSFDKCSQITNIIDVAEKLEIKLSLTEAQNVYFRKLSNGLTSMIENLSKTSNYESDKEFISEVLRLGEKLSFNLNKYYALLSKNLVTNVPKPSSIMK